MVEPGVLDRRIMNPQGVKQNKVDRQNEAKPVQCPESFFFRGDKGMLAPNDAGFQIFTFHFTSVFQWMTDIAMATAAECLHDGYSQSTQGRLSKARRRSGTRQWLPVYGRAKWQWPNDIHWARPAATGRHCLPMHCECGAGQTGSGLECWSHYVVPDQHVMHGLCPAQSDSASDQRRIFHAYPAQGERRHCQCCYFNLIKDGLYSVKKARASRIGELWPNRPAWAPGLATARNCACMSECQAACQLWQSAGFSRPNYE